MAEQAAVAATAATTPTSTPKPGSTSEGVKQPETVQSSAQPKSWKSKVDGKEVTWSNEDELVRDAGLGKAAFQRMREASEAKKAVDDFWTAFQKDPMAALNHPNIKLTKEQKREFIEKYYQREYLDADQMTPEQKRIRELEDEKRRWEDERKQVADKKAADEKAVVEGKWRDTYQKQIIDALEKGGIPKTPRSAARVAFHMAHAADAGFEAPINVIIDRVKQDYTDEIQAMCSDDLPIESVLKILPPNLVKRIRKYDLDQYRARQAKLNSPPTEQAEPTTAPKKPKREERLSYGEVLRKLGS